MTRALRCATSILIWLFVLLITVQFYLAGHGAMEGAHAADKSLLNDSALTRWIAALHAVNAIIVTGLAIDLAVRLREYLPVARFRLTAQPMVS